MCTPLLPLAMLDFTVIELQGPVPVNGFPLFEVRGSMTDHLTSVLLAAGYAGWHLNDRGEVVVE